METGLGGGTVRRRVVAGLTDQTLSCAARAHVATAARHTACLHVSRAMRAACRPAGTAERGGSPAGPKPGRASFYGELGGALWSKRFLRALRRGIRRRRTLFHALCWSLRNDRTGS